MAYRITITTIRPNTVTPFASPNPVLNDLRLSVDKARKIAAGFLKETRHQTKLELVVVRDWADKASSDTFDAAHAAELEQIRTLWQAYYTPNEIKMTKTDEEYTPAPAPSAPTPVPPAPVAPAPVDPAPPAPETPKS